MNAASVHLILGRTCTPSQRHLSAIRGSPPRLRGNGQHLPPPLILTLNGTLEALATNATGNASWTEV